MASVDNEYGNNKEKRKEKKNGFFSFTVYEKERKQTENSQAFEKNVRIKSLVCIFNVVGTCLLF